MASVYSAKMFNYYTENSLFGADYSLFLKPILATGKKYA